LTLFQAGINKPDSSDTSMSAKNSSVPATSFIDRLDVFNEEETGTGESNTVPSQEEITVDQNPINIRNTNTRNNRQGVNINKCLYCRWRKPK
jgi:hypothetical protein